MMSPAMVCWLQVSHDFRTDRILISNLVLGSPSWVIRRSRSQTRILVESPIGLWPFQLDVSCAEWSDCAVVILHSLIQPHTCTLYGSLEYYRPCIQPKQGLPASCDHKAMGRCQSCGPTGNVIPIEAARVSQNKTKSYAYLSLRSGRSVS